MPDLGFSPDADYPLIYGEKGITSFDLVCNNINEEIIENLCDGCYALSCGCVCPGQ